MGFTVIALAVFGFAVGVVFRLKVLLPILAVTLVGSVIFALMSRYGSVDTILTVFIVQIIIQGGYFFGTIARSFFSGNQRMRPIL